VFTWRKLSSLGHLVTRSYAARVARAPPSEWPADGQTGITPQSFCPDPSPAASLV